jgi:hypothetical protein
MQWLCTLEFAGPGRSALLAFLDLPSDALDLLALGFWRAPFRFFRLLTVPDFGLFVRAG